MTWPSNDDSVTATEESPLLGQAPTVGEVDDEEDEGEEREEQENDVPLAEEPSTSKLLVVLLAVWIGVFFAAAGRPHLFYTTRFRLAN